MRKLLVAILFGLVATASAQPAQPARPAAPARPVRAKPGKVDVAKATAALRGADVAAAAKAAAELGGSPDPAHHEPLLDALATGVHPDVLVAGLTALTGTATKTDLQAIGAYVRYRNGAVRAAALRAFSKSIGDPTLVIESLSVFDAPVRAAASEAAGRMKLTAAVPALLVLLDKGEAPAALALGAMADEALARTVAEHLGVAPDATLAVALGAMLARLEFGPETIRVDLVRTLSKLSGVEALDALEGYVEIAPENPPRQSRREAEAVLKARQGDR